LHANLQLVHNEEYDNDHEQNVNPVAGFWESRADAAAESAEQPQD
jgi:hypothetical protein